MNRLHHFALLLLALPPIYPQSSPTTKRPGLNPQKRLPDVYTRGVFSLPCLAGKNS